MVVGVFSFLRCYHAGRVSHVVPKASSANSTTLGAIASNLWVGYVLECNFCGVIFMSRENWFDNKEPETRGVVHSTVCHMWPGLRAPQGTHNGPRLLVDSVNSISATFSSLTTDSLKSLGEYVSDSVAPSYWQPNADCS